MARIAKKIVRFVLVVLLVEFFSAGFLTTPETSPTEDICYDVHHSSLLLPAFLKEETEKEQLLISFARLNIFTTNRSLSARQNVKNQKILCPKQFPRFALLCSLRI
jgi:hypothetical protein